MKVYRKSNLSAKPQLLFFFAQLFWVTTVRSIPLACITLFPRNVFVDASSVQDEVSRRSCDIPSGGCAVDFGSDENIITQFLSSSPIEKFHIQGWRWHTLSLVRDCSRLGTLMKHLLDSTSYDGDSSDATIKAVDHVIDFNLSGLQRIENDLFFPWLREKLTKGNEISSDVKQSFGNILDIVDEEREKVEELANLMRSERDLIKDIKEQNALRMQAISQLHVLSQDLSSIVKSIFEKEEKLLVPGVAAIVPSKEQKSFNNKVLRKLGLFDSRVHLVGMYDTVWDVQYGNEKEQKLFSEEIPTLPQMMIPRWRRSLYRPQAGVLDIRSEPSP